MKFAHVNILLIINQSWFVFINWLIKSLHVWAGLPNKPNYSIVLIVFFVNKKESKISTLFNIRFRLNIINQENPNQFIGMDFYFVFFHSI